MLTQFFQSFSNREISLFIWSAIIISFILSSKSLRRDVSNVVKTAFASKLAVLYILLIAYILLIVFILIKVDFWGISLLKDTIFWTFGSAIILIFNLKKIKRNADFKPLLMGIFKWTIFVEFVVALYSFSIFAELIIFPIVTFLGIMKAYSDTDEQHSKVNSILGKFLNIIAFTILAYTVYKVFTDSKTLFAISALKSFTLPIILSLSFLPFIYVLNIYMKYESLALRINFIIPDKKMRDVIKWKVLKTSRLNLSKYNNIYENIMLARPFTPENVEAKIKAISTQSAEL